MTRREGIFATLVAAAVATAVFFAFHPSTTFWALSNGADLGPAARAVWAACAPIPFLLFLAARRTGGGERPAGGRRRTPPPPLVMTVVAAAAFLLFFHFRSRNLFHGDGWLLTTFLERNNDPIALRPGWGTIWIHRLVYRALLSLGAASAQLYAFALLSSLAGAASVLLAARGARAVAADLPPEARRVGAAIGASLLLTTGAMQLFFGHVENYSLVQVPLLAFLATGTETLFSGRRPLLPLLCFAVAVFLHTASVLLLPAVLFLMAATLRPALLRPARILAWSGVVALLLLPPTGAQLRMLVAFHPWTSHGHPFSIGHLSAAHGLILFNLFVLLVPVPAAALLAGAARGVRPAENLRDRRTGSFLALAALSFLAFTVTVKPFLGNRDWDLCAFLAPPVALWAAWRFIRSVRPAALLPSTLLAAGAGLFLLFPWVAGNADPAAAGERTLRFTIDDPYQWHGDRPRALDVATVTAERGQTGAARVLMEEITRRRPDLAIARADWGILLWEEGRYGEAREHLEAAVALDPSLDPPLYYLGATLFHLLEEDLGESRFREFLERRPGNPSAAGYLGRALMARGEWAEAKEWLLVAEESLPGNADLQAWLGRTCLMLGDREEARRRGDRALRLDPNHEEARRLIAEARPEPEREKKPGRTYATPR
ncbi:MAG: hypothetical protein JW958_11650 [Candidatus Eisenbacteria bacterium]|nr:hypothetical protein [Candidatus Eisenbacteria bacterium]